jgi:hypothetical protein
MNTPEQKAQIARVNRILGKHSLKLCTSSPREVSNLGSYHIIDTYTNTVVWSHLKLEELKADWMDAILLKGWAN